MRPTIYSIVAYSLAQECAYQDIASHQKEGIHLTELLPHNDRRDTQTHRQFLYLWSYLTQTAHSCIKWELSEAFIWYAIQNISGNIHILTLIPDPSLWQNVQPDLCKLFPKHFVIIAIRLWKVRRWDMRVVRYDFLSASCLIRHDESQCDLYRQVPWHDESFSLSVHTCCELSGVAFPDWQIL
jgi:hypothetical protein